MATYMMLTRLTAAAQDRPEDLATLGQTVADLLEQEAPDAKWVSSYGVLGPFDYLDIYEAPNEEVAMKVALAIRNVSGATTETYVLTPYERFTQLDKEVTS